MSSRPVRIALVAVGVLAVIVGALWIGQGSGLIPGSAMSGDRTWFYVGIVVLVVGIILLVVGIRRNRRP